MEQYIRNIDKTLQDHGYFISAEVLEQVLVNLLDSMAKEAPKKTKKTDKETPSAE